MSKWHSLTLRDLVTLQRGHDLTAQERVVGQVPVLGAAGHNGYHNTALARGPGIVMGRSGGSFGQVHFSEVDFWPHNTALYVTDFKGNDPRFAYYILKTLNFDSYNSGSAQPSLNRNFIYPIKIRVPQPDEQSAIAAVLSALDAKIELNQRINAELEGMAKLLYDYWFVQFDFPISADQAAAMGKPRLAGKPYRSSGGKMTYHPDLKREIPDVWEGGSFGEIADNFRDGIDPKHVDESTPYVGLEHIERQNFSLWRWGLSGDVDSQKSRFQSGDFLFGKLRPYFHKVCQTPFDGICSTDILVIRAKDPKYQGLVGSQIFESDFVAHTTKHSSGTQMPRANWSAMSDYPITIPDDGTLEAFNEHMKPLASKRNNSALENQELTALRDWLLPMLMNGQVTVS